MEPVAFSVINNDLKHASFKRDVSINNVSFISSLGEVAKAQKMVVTDGSKLSELNIKRNEDDWWLAQEGEGEDAEEKILGFLVKIKKILTNQNK